MAKKIKLNKKKKSKKLNKGPRVMPFKAIVSFPASVLKPVKSFLVKEERELREKKKRIKAADPFSDSARTRDNAAIDAEAAEQFGHEKSSAMQREVERKLIQVRKALASIKIGHYGTCEKCGKMINTDRLMVIPEATICIKCEAKKDK